MSQSDKLRGAAAVNGADGGLAPADSALPASAAEVANENPPRGSSGMPQFVTRLAPLEQQVGLHVIAALEHPETLAVISTVVAGPDGGQQIVSIGLDADRFGQIQALLAAADQEHKQRVQCFGFHCRFEDDAPDA